jgi:hypothetical protein
MSRVSKSLLVVGLAVAVASPPAYAAEKVKLPGSFLGGITSSGWPVVLQVTRNGKTVTKAVMAIRTQCTSGKSFIDHDTYNRLKVSRSGRFSASFGPEANGSPAPGVTETAQGSISGRFNKARTKASGTWHLTFVDKDASGNVVDTCDSGAVAWRAQQ